MKDNWISVNERLPELHLVLTEFEYESYQSDWVQAATDKDVLLGSYFWTGKKWYNNSDSQPETRIKFWQPLPAPPNTPEV